jgi:hypothetical protein
VISERLKSLRRFIAFLPVLRIFDAHESASRMKCGADGPANDMLQFLDDCPPTAPTLPLKLRGYGTSRWQLSVKAICLTGVPVFCRDAEGIRCLQSRRSLVFAAMQSVRSRATQPEFKGKS